MRLLIALALMAIPFAAVAQGSGQGLSEFSKIHPQLVIDVKPAPSTTAQIVEITMGDEKYPTKLLESQATTLCTLLGSAPRGLAVAKSAMEGSNVMFVRANFATDGLILPGGGLQVAAILKAFAGAAAPFTISQFDIAFEGVHPTKNTVESFSIPGVLKAEARYIPQPETIEYRVELLSQDPGKIEFPSSSLDVPAPKPTPPPPKPESKTPLIVLVCVAGLALAALVYLAFLRWGLRAPTKKVPKL